MSDELQRSTEPRQDDETAPLRYARQEKPIGKPSHVRHPVTPAEITKEQCHVHDIQQSCYTHIILYTHMHESTCIHNYDVINYMYLRMEIWKEGTG